jgi:hypothetical protein
LVTSGFLAMATSFIGGSRARHHPGREESLLPRRGPRLTSQAYITFT